MESNGDMMCLFVSVLVLVLVLVQCDVRYDV